MTHKLVGKQSWRGLMWPVRLLYVLVFVMLEVAVWRPIAAAQSNEPEGSSVKALQSSSSDERPAGRQRAALLPVSGDPANEELRQRVMSMLSDHLRTQRYFVIKARKTTAVLKDDPRCEDAGCARSVLAKLNADIAVGLSIWLAHSAQGKPLVKSLRVTVSDEEGSYEAPAEVAHADVSKAIADGLQLCLAQMELGPGPHLSVEGTPLGAVVAVDDARVGNLPWLGKVEPGRRKLGVSLDGFAPHEELLQVPADSTRLIRRRVSLLEARGAGATVSAGYQENHWSNWLIGGVAVAVGAPLVVYGAQHAVRDGSCGGGVDRSGECEGTVAMQAPQVMALVAGGALVVGGILWWAFQPIPVSVSVSDQGAAASIAGRF